MCNRTRRCKPERPPTKTLYIHSQEKSAIVESFINRMNCRKLSSSKVFWSQGKVIALQKTVKMGTQPLTSGFVSSGSSIIRVSSQSSGFLASGSGMVFGGRKSQSSSRLPPSTRLLSILTSYVLSDRTISVYRWVNSSSYGGGGGKVEGGRG